MKDKVEISKADFENAKEDLEELERAVQAMISDLHELKGMQQARIAYFYYRKLIWAIKENLGLDKKF
jgi:tetrahydromethanopterin S-methyltransferase subunit G